MENFFTTFEAAKICHVSPGSMIRWIHEGKLPASITPGGHHRIEGKNLTLFLKQLRMPIPAELTNDKMKFLLITESAPMARSLRKWLEGFHADSIVEDAQDYFMAGWKASRLQPDLVILDLNLTSGAEVIKVCELMRAFFEYKNTPLLIMVSNPSAAARKKILSLGQSDWVSKPLEKDLFSEKLGALLKKGLAMKLTGS